MAILIVGLLGFLGVHLVRVIAPQWREQRIAALGEGPWKGIYSLVSVVTLILIVWGYSLAHDEAAILYDPPAWSRSLSLLAMPVVLAVFLAANFPAGFIKRIFKHPMLWGTIAWAVLHLIGNGDLASVLMFGGFLVWAVATLMSALARPQPDFSNTKVWPDAVSVALALAVTWFLLAGGHEWLFGAPIA